MGGGGGRPNRAWREIGGERDVQVGVAQIQGGIPLKSISVATVKLDCFSIM